MSEPPPPPPPPSGPDVPPSPEPPPPEPGVCPRCGAPHDPYQEYCLECGHRLPSPYGMRTREIWSRDSPLWLWAALLALLLVALVAGAIVAIAATRGDKEGQPKTSIPVVTTGPSTTDTVGVITQPPTTVTINPPTTTFGSTTTLSTTTTTTGNVTWPAGKDGYSIFLKSVPTSEGRAKADAAAQRARNNGLSQVGVLNSSDFSSLRPGYWVTFTGIYDTQQQANAALPNARARGFPTAYTRPVRD
ncbi:MAG TPA: hypothetical protein VN960_05305 [Gaiellaceae bacterium]|jgi:hypothetical protein|nr:hypothetical protein [Gaiellaceae bacterium]